MTFGAHKLVPSHFWTTDGKCDNCCQRCIATCGKKLYRCTSTFLVVKYCGGFFSNSVSYLYEVARTNFSADFGVFSITISQKIVAPPSDWTDNYVVHLKGQSLLEKKQWNLIKIDPCDTIPVQSIPPSNEQRAGLGAWQTKTRNMAVITTSVNQDGQASTIN